MSTNDYRDTAVRFSLRGMSGTDGIVFRAFAERARSLHTAAGPVVDIGCGSGRSTRFLRDLGFTVTGVDVSEAMIAEARRLDPAGRYVLRGADAPLPFGAGSIAVVFSSWAILEQNTRPALARFLHEATRILVSGGAAFIVTNTPEFYAGRWVSCDVDFPENSVPLTSGQRVKARLLPQDVVVSDVFWSDEDYVGAIEEAGLVLVAAHRPLADAAGDERWLDESSIAPYVMYEIRKP